MVARTAASKLEKKEVHYHPPLIDEPILAQETPLSHLNLYNRSTKQLSLKKTKL